MFTLDTTILLSAIDKPLNMNHTQCRIYNNNFYFLEKQGFQYEKGNNRFAVIYSISLSDYAQEEIKIPYPSRINENKKRVNSDLWIYDFDFYEDLLLVTTQENIVIYKKTEDSRYEIISIDENHKNLFTAYYDGLRLNYFEEDHDRGFKWFQKDINGDSVILVRELLYDAPHVVQIQPNRYFFHNKENVFFLSNRFPKMDIYTKDGMKLQTVEFNLPNWKAFEDEYIKHSLSKPYGVERIMAVKDDLFSYSYPKVVFPFFDEYMLFYLQFDTTIGKSVLQYAILNHDKQIHRYSFNYENGKYVAAQFPFNLFRSSYDKGNVSEGNTLVQLTFYSDISWNNKTDKEYLTQLNSYFDKNEANVAYKIMRYNGGNAKSDEYINSGIIHNKTNEKDVYIIHGELECSGCTKSIYIMLNSSEELFRIHQIYSRQLTGLQRQEVQRDIKQTLGKHFSIENIQDLKKEGISIPKLSELDYPCIILRCNNKKTRVYKVSDIFTNDVSITNFKKEFIEEWEDFLSE